MRDNLRNMETLARMNLVHVHVSMYVTWYVRVCTFIIFVLSVDMCTYLVTIVYYTLPCSCSRMSLERLQACFVRLFMVLALLLLSHVA